MIDLLLGLLGVALVAVVVVGWRWHHQEHRNARAHPGPPKPMVVTDGVAPLEGREDWATPRPASVPGPTYWPAVAAFGVASMALGALTSLLLSMLGLLVFVVALTQWIREMIHVP